LRPQDKRENNEPSHETLEEERMSMTTRPPQEKTATTQPP